jgi:F-type H+-transporting ATPase subunit b
MILFGFAENSIQLVPDGTLFLHIAIILLMVWVLNNVLFKPVNAALDRRAQSTKGRSHEAHDILQRVEQKLSDYERSLREARVEGYTLMEQQRAEAISARQMRLNQVREEVNRLIEEEKRNIGLQSGEARRTLEQDARRTAAEIGERVLHRPIANG